MAWQKSPFDIVFSEEFKRARKLLPDAVRLWKKANQMNPTLKEQAKIALKAKMLIDKHLALSGNNANNRSENHASLTAIQSQQKKNHLKVTKEDEITNSRLTGDEFRLMKGLRWNEVHITFISSESVRICVV